MNIRSIALPALIAGAALLAGACSNSASGGTAASSPPAAAKPIVSVAADQLHAPWAITFSGDTVYISEREGTIVRISGGEKVRQTIRLNKPLEVFGEGGFLGLVAAPDFAVSKTAYAYHTYKEAGKVQNRVVLLRETPAGWQEVKALLEGIPGGTIHDGGRLAIGPDRHLYVTTGDAGQDRLAQDRGSLAGKILRMTLDGGVPADNPFPGSYVYSYGHRNSQGIAWDKNGVMYSTEHGPSGNPGGHDELNRIEAGNNYGWPDIIGDAQKTGMIKPLYHTGNTAIAPSGMAIDAQDNIWIATLRGTKLIRYNTPSKQIDTVLEGEGRLRDVAIHKGVVYVITNNTDGRGQPAANDDRLLKLIQ
ncbi:PQQ-dependent sugar dehydrogenase [Paenibacillus chartarius]|uniref:PQQ-dependent sugar dehydrogenase n=1 Tax=Paenibacillus chartarius TaxID=747481 RepID=A0ABV6DL57_9BACL